MPRAQTIDVDQELFVRTAPRKEFAAISTPGGLSTWMAVRAALTPKKGSAYDLEFDGGWRHQGTVQGIVPGRSISLQWALDGVPLQGTVLTLAVRPTMFKA